MAKTYRTANGGKVDLGALILSQENTRSVGNMGVNARGDRVNSHNEVVETRNEIVQNQYDKSHSTVVRDSGDVIPTSAKHAQELAQEVAKQTKKVVKTTAPKKVPTVAEEMLPVKTEDPIKKEFPHNILKKDQEEPEPVYEADDGALTEEQVEQVQDSAKEIPSVDDIKVEEPLESELNEKHKRNVGRFLSELDQKKPDRTTSFLNKVGNVTEKGVGINSIEYDVTDLQIGPAFTLDDDNKK